VLVLELGANDALRGLPVASTEGNLRAIIESAKKVGATVLLVGMQIPPNYGGEYATRFAGLFPKLAKEHQLPLVPFFLAPLLERPDLFQGDRLHPTAEAQPLLLDAVWPKLQPLLAR
jgi:acyl-CoA thioesterase-1